MSTTTTKVKIANRNITGKYVKDYIAKHWNRPEGTWFELINTNQTKDENGRPTGRLNYADHFFPNTCEIINSANKDDTSSEIITIKAIRRYVPGKENSFQAEVPELFTPNEYAFKKSSPQGHRMFFHKSKPGQKNLFEFLLLSNKNKSNVGQPFHIPPRAGNYVYTMNTEELGTQGFLNERKIKSQLTTEILELDDINVTTLCEFLFKRQDFKSQAQIEIGRSRLIKELEKSKVGFERVKEALENPDMLLSLVIKKAKDQGNIKYDPSEGWTHANGGKIVNVETHEEPTPKLLEYLKSDAGFAQRQQITSKVKAIQDI